MVRGERAKGGEIRAEERMSAEGGGGKRRRRAGASTVPRLQVLSAALLRVFPWTCDTKLTRAARRPHKENICRRVVARKRIDRVIILSKVEGK